MEQIQTQQWVTNIQTERISHPANHFTMPRPSMCACTCILNYTKWSKTPQLKKNFLKFAQCKGSVFHIPKSNNSQLSCKTLRSEGTTKPYILLWFIFALCEWRLLKIRRTDLSERNNIHSCLIFRHSCDVEYVDLLYEFGASLYHLDDKRRLACDGDAQNQCSKRIRQLIGTSNYVGV